MDNLWAPWRMEFITSKEEADGCFLCAAGRHAALAEADRAAYVVHRGERCFCIMNRFPYNNGHLLISPYDHVADLTDLDDATLLELMQMLRDAEVALTRTVQPFGFNAGLNLGEDAGAGLAEHLHMHLVPRWRGDTNFMPVVGQTKVIPQALDELYDLLTAAWGEEGGPC